MCIKTIDSDIYKESFLLYAHGDRACFEVRRVYNNQKALVEAIPLSLSSIEERQRLLEEYKTFSSAKPRNVISVQNAHYDASNRCLLVEFEYPYGSLDALVRDAVGAEMPLDEDFIWEVVACIADGLISIYSSADLGLNAHGKIWSANVFRTSSGNLVLGLPILRWNIDNQKMPPEYSRPKFSYLSPEVLHRRKLDEKSDIWMLGCLLYELCTLSPPPFDSAAITETPDLAVIQGRVSDGITSHELMLLIKSCLHYLPELRPSASIISNLCKQRASRIPSANLVDMLVSLPDNLTSSQSAKDQFRLIQESQTRLAAAREALLFLAIKNNDLEDVIKQKATFLRSPLQYLQRALGDCRSEIIYQFCLWNNEHKLGLEVPARQGVCTNSRTPLMVAALEGNPSKVSENLHLSGRYCYDYLTGGQTALYYAILGRNPECVKLLICELGVYNDKGYTTLALLQLSENRHHDYINLLLPESWIQPREAIESAAICNKDSQEGSDDFDKIQMEAQQRLEDLSNHLRTSAQKNRTLDDSLVLSSADSIKSSLQRCLSALREVSLK